MHPQYYGQPTQIIVQQKSNTGKIVLILLGIFIGLPILGCLFFTVIGAAGLSSYEKDHPRPSISVSTASTCSTEIQCGLKSATSK